MEDHVKMENGEQDVKPDVTAMEIETDAPTNGTEQNEAKPPIVDGSTPAPNDQMVPPPSASIKMTRAQAARKAFMAGMEAKTSHEMSSQYRRWTFSRDKLTEIRRELNEKTVDVCRTNFNKELELAEAKRRHESILSATSTDSLNPDQLPTSSSSASTSTTATTQPGTKPYKQPAMPSSFPSADDELLLIRFYCKQLVALFESGALNSNSGRECPPVILPLAITFLKRFYLRTSCLEWHPKTIMPVCLFLAGKTANHVFDIDSYVSVFDKMKKEDILDIEYVVFQTLKFDLFVPRIQHALHGWYIKLQQAPDADLERIDKAYESAKDYLARSRLSDVEFLHTPSQIAAACFRLADTELFESVLESMVSYHYKPKPVEDDGRGPPTTTATTTIAGDEEDTNMEDGEQALADLTIVLEHKEKLEKVLDAIGEAVVEIPIEFDLKKVKVVDKLVRAGHDPMKQKTSLLYQALQDAKLAAIAQKQALRLEKARHEMNEQETMFGPVIGNHATGRLGETGMGIRSDGGGLVFAGQGLRDVGIVLDDSDSD